jgi:hypothetical protein
MLMHKKWTLCMDSKYIHKIIVKYQYPLPRMDDILDLLGGAKKNSKVDLRSGYHQTWIQEGDEWNIGLKTKDHMHIRKFFLIYDDNAIFALGVDFSIHWLRWLWVSCSCGPCPNTI